MPQRKPSIWSLTDEERILMAQANAGGKPKA